jgi:hypothetical protein
MADSTAAVNGLYGNQYSQPAELAASTPSAPAHASSASVASTTASATAQKADPQEIGWYFVEQYYTTLSKSPERIHLFYKKKSQLVTGREAEKVLPAIGEKASPYHKTYMHEELSNNSLQAISEKIKSLDIRDCKVRVLNVDSQASFSNIVVQVIGEMSNKNQPHHKFVQTFVLAEQPNGYFVLNDIFRYLNEDEDDIVEDEAQAEVPASEPATPADPTVPMPTKELVATESAAEEVDTKLNEEKEVESALAEAAPVNGVDEEESVEEPTAETDSAAAEAEPIAENGSPEAVVEEAAPEPTPAASAKPAEPAPEPAAAPKPKTWAGLLSGGKTPAVPAVPALPSQPTAPSQAKSQKPATQPAAPKAPVTEPAAASASPTPSNGWQEAGHGKKGRSGTQTKTEGNTLAYIKNVNEKVDARTLRDVLEKYGELKYYDVARPRVSDVVPDIEEMLLTSTELCVR